MECVCRPWLLIFINWLCLFNLGGFGIKTIVIKQHWKAISAYHDVAMNTSIHHQTSSDGSSRHHQIISGTFIMCYQCVVIFDAPPRRLPCMPTRHPKRHHYFRGTGWQPNGIERPLSKFEKGEKNVCRTWSRHEENGINPSSITSISVTKGAIG